MSRPSTHSAIADERNERIEIYINGEFFLTLKGGHQLKLSRSYKDKLRYFTPHR